MKVCFGKKLTEIAKIRKKMTLPPEKKELTGYPVSKIKDVVVDLTLQLLDNLLDVTVQSLWMNPRS